MTIFRINGIQVHFPLQIGIGNILRNRKSKAELSVAHGVIPYKNRIRVISKTECFIISLIIIQASYSDFTISHCRIHDTSKIRSQCSGRIQHLSFNSYFFQSFKRDSLSIYGLSINRRYLHTVLRIVQFHGRVTDQTET